MNKQNCHNECWPKMLHVCRKKNFKNNMFWWMFYYFVEENSLEFQQMWTFMYFQLYKAPNFCKIPQEIWLTLSQFTGRQEKKTPWLGLRLEFDKSRFCLIFSSKFPWLPPSELMCNSANISRYVFLLVQPETKIQS